jgi:hypothetical protein
LNAVDAGQIHSAQLEQVGPQVELRGVLRPSAAPFRLARLTLVSRQGGQHFFQLQVAFGQLHSISIVQRHRLLEGEQVLFPPIALQGLGDLFFAGPNSCVLELRQRQPIAAARPESPG